MDLGFHIPIKHANISKNCYSNERLTMITCIFKYNGKPHGNQLIIAIQMPLTSLTPINSLWSMMIPIHMSLIRANS